MNDIYLQVRVTVNPAAVDKLNKKRLRSGRQQTTAVEEAVNAIGSALMHNWLFEPGSIRVKEIEVRNAAQMLMGE